MTTRDFCYWLQGYYELNGTKKFDITADESFHEMVRGHLKLVFKHDPSFVPPVNPIGPGPIKSDKSDNLEAEAYNRLANRNMAVQQYVAPFQGATC